MVGAGIFISGGLPCPSEDLFMYFVSHCSTNLNLQFKTIKLYLCGIRRAYIEHGLGDPFILPGNLPMLQLQQVLRGIKKCQPQLCKPRLPITYEILSQFVAIMDRGFFGKYLDALMKSACCVSFFGFLRRGEFTSPTSKFDNSTGLTRLDILFNNLYEDLVTELHLVLQSSKTDPFRQGIIIKLFRTSGAICPIQNTIAFLRLRDSSSHLAHGVAPLFAMPNGEPLTRNLFINMLNQLCRACGLNPLLYSGHSLRIGAATSAAKQNVANHLIQVLGRWSSDCYKTYIKTSPETLWRAQCAIASN